MSDLSVIVPVLDEEEILPALFDLLDEQQRVDMQVIVVDGGSRDASREIARTAGAKVVVSKPGRGAQMNAGARVATADWLLFLHADSRFGFSNQVRCAIDTIEQHDPQTAGHFGLRFTDRPNDGFLYRYMEAKTITNRPYTINGDQGLLISREWFREIGGFDVSLPFLEDQRIARAIRDNGEWVLLPGRLQTSARRFVHEGPYRRYLLMALIMAMYATDQESFLKKTPDVYRVQSNTDTLLLAPFLFAAQRHLLSGGVKQYLSHWYEIGQFAVRQSWQLWFAADVFFEKPFHKRRIFTWMYDRVVVYFVQNPFGYIFVTLFVWFGFTCILGPCMWFIERRRS